MTQPQVTGQWIPTHPVLPLDVKNRPLDSNVQNDLVMDIGVHKGEDTEFYLKKGFRVIGIEACPAVYEAARDRLQQYIDSGRLVLINVAIADKTGPVSFYSNLNVSVWGTTSLEWAERNERLGAPSTKISVQGQRFEEILEEFGIPYYLKVDIEGTDVLCTRALREFEEKPKFVSLESTKTSWQGLLDEFALLRQLGYDRFKVVQQEDVPSQTCPFPAREGKYVSHQFEQGASGLFGEEAPGEWLSEAEAVRVYKRIFRAYRTFGDDAPLRRWRFWRVLTRIVRPKVGWYDTHAALHQ